MKWSHQRVFILTAALLFTSVLLRSLLFYRDDPILTSVLGLLSAWLLLFIIESILSKSPEKYSWHVPIYLILQMILVLAMLSLTNSSDYVVILFCVLAMQVMQRESPRVAATWIGLFGLVLILSLVSIHGIANGIALALIFTASNVLLAFYVLATRRAQAARAGNQALAQRLQEANRQLQTHSRVLEQLAVARERQRLARELHDSVTQTIFSMTLTTQSALLLMERDHSRVDEQFDRLTRLASSALSEMRVLIAELGSGKAGEGSLGLRLRQHLQDRHLPDGLAITLEAQGSGSLSGLEEQGLFRIVQEALNNIVKHAGATRGCVRLHLAEPFWMEILDDGRGFELERARNGDRVGLVGMQERASEIGWTLSIVTSPGAGTRIRLDKPLGERREGWQT